MTDPENIVLVHLRRMDEKLDKLANALSDNTAELHILKSHMLAFFQSGMRHDTSIASVLVRLDRIERRLDLSE